MCRCVCFVSIMLLNIIQYVSYIETGFTKINTMKNVKPNGCITQTLCSQLHYLFSVTLKKTPFQLTTQKILTIFVNWLNALSHERLRKQVRP